MSSCALERTWCAGTVHILTARRTRDSRSAEGSTEKTRRTRALDGVVGVGARKLESQHEHVVSCPIRCSSKGSESNRGEVTVNILGELCCTRGQTAKGEDGQRVRCSGKHCNCSIGPSPFAGRKCPSHRQLTSSKMSSCALEKTRCAGTVHVITARRTRDSHTKKRVEIPQLESWSTAHAKEN